jgi:hypothetical protein
MVLFMFIFIDPEECSFIFFLDMVVFTHLFQGELPDYLRYVRETHDMRASYHFYRQVLQIFSYKYPPEDHWTVKSPFPHLYYLPILLSIFPDASVIICHRDPVECVPSMISLSSVFAKAFWKGYDPSEKSQSMLDMFAEGAIGAMKFRSTLPPEQDAQHFFDLDFDEFVKVRNFKMQIQP